MAEDFFVKFGSDASEFADKLKADLAPARREVAQLGLALQALDAAGTKTADGLTAKLGGVAAGDAKRLGQGAGPSQDFSKVASDLNGLADHVSEITGQLKGIVQALGKAVPGMAKTAEKLNKQRAAEERVDEGRGTYIDRTRPGRFITNEEAATNPNAVRVQRNQLPNPSLRELNPSQSRGAFDLNNLKLQPLTLAPAAIASLSKIQIDEAGFDRVVKSVESVEAAVDRLAGRLPTTVGKSQPGVTDVESGKVKKKDRKAASDVAPAADNLEGRVARLQAQLAEFSTRRRQSEAVLEELLKGGGVEVPAEFKQAQAESKAQEDALKAQLNAAQRELLGETKAEQKAKRRAVAQQEREAQPDLTRKEYDERIAARKAIGVTADEARFRASIGRGKELQKDDLRNIAGAFKMAGFDPGVRVKDPIQGENGLVEKILSARQAFSSQYGPGEYPESLRVGSKPQMDSAVSENVRTMLGVLNEVGESAKRVNAAWETVRRSGETGGSINKPTIEPGYGQVPTGVGSSIISTVAPGVRGMVKGRPNVGGAIVDESELVDAWLEINQDRHNKHGAGLARAAELAQRSDFNPHDPALSAEIKGPSHTPDKELTEAGRSRIALGRLRGATEELDQLGDRFLILTEAMVENGKFIKRVSERVAEGSGEEEKLAQAMANRDRILAKREALLIDSHTKQEVPGLRETFQSGDYWSGFNKRMPAHEQRAMDRMLENRDAIPNYLGGRWGEEAQGQALVGRRLAAGTKDTYVRDLPGLGFGGRSDGGRPNKTPEFYSLDGTIDPKEIKKLNKANRDLAVARAKAKELHDDENVDEEQLAKAVQHLENSAVRLANKLVQLVGQAPPLEALTEYFKKPTPEQEARGEQGDRVVHPISEKNLAGETARLEKLRAAKAATTAKLKDTPEQAEARALLGVQIAQNALEKAKKKQVAAAEKVAKTEAKLGLTADKLSDREVTQLAISEAKIRTLQGQLNALETVWSATEDRAARDKPAIQTGNTGELTRAQAHLAEGERQAAEARRQAGIQQGVATRYKKLAAAAEDPKKKEEYLGKSAAALDRSTAARELAASLKASLPGRREWIAAAEAGLRSSTALLQRDKPEGHHPGEDLDSLGYPSALGYHPDRLVEKQRLTEELAQAKRDRTQLVPASLDRLREAAKLADREVARLTAELEKLGGKAVETSEKAVRARTKQDKAGIKAAEERLAEANRRLSEAKAPAAAEITPLPEGFPRLFHGAGTELPEQLLPRDQVKSITDRMQGVGLYATTSQEHAGIWDKHGTYEVAGTKSGKPLNVFDLEQKMSEKDVAEFSEHFRKTYGAGASGLDDTLKVAGNSKTWMRAFSAIEDKRVGGEGAPLPNEVLTSFLEQKRKANVLRYDQDGGDQGFVFTRPEDLKLRRVGEEAATGVAPASKLRLKELEKEVVDAAAALKKLRTEAAKPAGKAAPSQADKASELRDAIAGKDWDRAAVLSREISRPVGGGDHPVSGELTETDAARRKALIKQRADLEAPTGKGVKELGAAASQAAKNLQGATMHLGRANKSGDEEKIAAAQARVTQRKAELASAQAALADGKAKHETSKKLSEQITALDPKKRAAGGAGGAGGGSGTPPTTGAAGHPGGPHGGDDILRQILSELNSLHATIKNGVKVNGTVKTSGLSKGDSTPSKPKAPAPGAVAGGGARLTPEQRTERESLTAASRAMRTKVAAVKLAGEELRLQQEEEKLAKRRAGQTQRTTATEQEQARAVQKLAAAHGILSADAVRALANLKHLNETEKDATKIAEAQVHAYNAVAASLEKVGIAGSAQRGIHQDLQSHAMGRTVKGSEVQDIARTAHAVDGYTTVDKAMASGVNPGGIFGEQSLFTKAMFGNHGFWSRIMSSTGTFVVRNFAAGFVFGLTNALQEVIHQGIITESTFIRVSDALEQTGRTSGNLRTQLQSISSQYGTQLNDVYETAAGLTGLFDSVDDIAGATRVVSQLQAISMGALNAQEAMGALASITGAFGNELEGGVGGLTHVADVLTVIQNTLGTNVEATAEGVASMSGLAQQLKIDFEDSATYVAQIQKLTNQSGAAAGEQFSRILATMQSGRGQAALAKALPDSGIETQLGQGQYGDALKNLMRNWDTLSESQQRNLAVTLAGQRQARAFAALMNNSTKVLNTAARAHEANGEAADRAKAIAATLNAEVSKLGSNLQNLAQNLVRTGVLDFFGVLLKVTNGVLALVNGLFSRINDLADGNPMTRFLKHMTMGLLGLVVTLTVAAKAFAGFKASLRAVAATEIVAPGIAAASAQSGGIRAGMVAAPMSLSRRLDAAAMGLSDRANAARMPTPASRPVSAPLGASPWSPGSTPPPRTFVVDSAGVAEQQGVARSARVYSAAATAANRASAGMAKVGGGMAALGSLGMGASLGIMAAVAALAAMAGQMKATKDVADDVANYYKEKFTDEGKPKSKTQMIEEYIGPESDKAKQRLKDTSSIAGGVLWGAGTRGVSQVLHPIDTIKSRWSSFRTTGNPLRLTSLGDFMPGADGKGTDSSFEQDYKKWRGILSDDQAKELMSVHQRASKQLDQIDPQVHLKVPGVPTAFDWDSSNMQAAINNPAETIEKATAAQKELGANIAKARKSIMENDDMSGSQKQAALGELEAIQKANNERVAGIILVSQGIMKADQLSTDQIAQIDSLRSMLATTATSGGVNTGNEDYADTIKTLIEQTGVREGSPISDALGKLGEGNLSKVEALQADSDALDIEITNLQAKYKAGVSSETPLEEGQLEEIQKQLMADLSARAQRTQDILNAFVEESTALSEAAVRKGEYYLAGYTTRSIARKFHNQRDIPNESAEQKAANDATESQMAERAASYQSQEQSQRLNMVKARGVGSKQGAHIEEQIARNTYQALLDAKTMANISGLQGPTFQALMDAKRAWVESQHGAEIAAQENVIAGMALKAAGEWNDLAAAGDQQDIAFQQWQDARANAGAGSTEAKNAHAAYKNSIKSGIEAQDQVAQATRDASLAAIPQGNAVAVANQGVANAQAALAAAQKYEYSSTQYQGALATLASAQQQAQSAQAALTQAQASLAQAYADARGDAVASAQAGVTLARATLAAALQASGGATSADVLAAQGQLVAANAAVMQSQADLIQSRVQISIALAEAGGHTVHAAVLQLRAARLALASALKKSKGEHTAEVNQARAGAIQAQAAARDARLQDELDTIDFNLQMNKITQSSAIAALREILRTHDLTKAQRRQLLLQIKGMKDEMANSQWNFGDIKLPTPYAMKRYIEQRRQALEANLNHAAIGASNRVEAIDMAAGGGRAGDQHSSVVNNYQFVINGADTAKVQRIIRDTVGQAGRTRTTQPRRGR